VTPLTALPGVWEGPGEGHYPTIDPFGYREELTFTRLGDTLVLHYAQRTWHDDGRALHTECGYLRIDGDRVELVVAQPTGFAESHHGVLDGGVIAFGLTAFGRVATAKPVQTLRRRWALVDGVLHVDLWMTFAGVVDAHHLHAELTRRSADQPPAGPTADGR
jgi:hypothetical protein